MSSSMYWRPAPKERPPARPLSDDLKYRLARRLWDHDGSVGGDEVELGKEDLPYLEGLADGGVDGADDLVAAIHDHGRVLVWIVR